MVASFREVLSDLGRVKSVHLEVKGKAYLVRNALLKANLYLAVSNLSLPEFRKTYEVVKVRV